MICLRKLFYFSNGLCHPYWLPMWPFLLMFGEFRVLCYLLGGIALLLLYEENVRYLLSQDAV